MVDVLGYDIGGANTKAVLIHTEEGKAPDIKVAVEYFPIWREPQKLTDVIIELKEKLAAEKLDAIGITMTAELSDAPNQRQGVHQIFLR